MIRAFLVLLILWALGSGLLWTVQSRAVGSCIDIGWRDRAVALFWLPLTLFLILWGVLLWAYDRGRCA